MSDMIYRQAAIDAFGLSEKTRKYGGDHSGYDTRMLYEIQDVLEGLPSAEPEIIRCRDCKHWRQQTNYQGALLSFGFCESDDMWRSLYGETYEVSHIDTDDDFYCGYAERRTDG